MKYFEVIDVLTGAELPHGQAGEICVRSPTIMSGYLNRPDETANTIDKDKWLHTGYFWRGSFVWFMLYSQNSFFLIIFLTYWLNSRYPILLIIALRSMMGPFFLVVRKHVIRKHLVFMAQN